MRDRGRADRGSMWSAELMRHGDDAARCTAIAARAARARRRKRRGSSSRLPCIVMTCGTPASHGGPCAVDGHGELVAVRDVDRDDGGTAAASDRAHAGENGRSSVKRLDGDAASPCSWRASHPSPIAGRKTTFCAPAACSVAGEIGDDTLGAARAVGLDQLRDRAAHHADDAHHGLTFRSPTASATSV